MYIINLSKLHANLAKFLRKLHVASTFRTISVKKLIVSYKYFLLTVLYDLRILLNENKLLLRWNKILDSTFGGNHLLMIPP